jgi:hypothetical protein
MGRETPTPEVSDVTTGSIGPGTLLAGRYRLDDLLAETEGARFWRATDTVLARSVAIHAVPSDDPRAPELLEAARLSATVVDPHLLRVLDCDVSAGITWVVNEWGDGISLDRMLQQGTLPPSRAAWLTREVAEAIAAGHAQGATHGRLNPESVLVTHAGAVKLIGYVVDASLHPGRTQDPIYGEIDDREADVINLAGILYAALTGRWPGVAPSSVPPAPREGRRPLRPRQVRAGVPRTLDTICERVLHKEASRHAMPIETAHEIAAALADHVGDPAASAPVDVSGMHHEPTVTIRPLDEDPDATQFYRAPSEGAEGPDTLAPLHPPVDQPPPPSPFPDLPDRPLFAPTERKVPAGARSERHTGSHAGSQTDGSAGNHTGNHAGVPPEESTGQEFWPFAGEPDRSEVHTGKEGRGWLRTAIVVGVLLVLVVAMAVAFNRGREDGSSPSGSTEEPSATASAQGARLELTGVTDFDPESDNPEENPEDAPKAIDGDPATSWTTSTYYNDPALGGLKSGVGLMVDLGSDQQPRSLTVRFKGAPTSFQVYAASPGVTASPESLDQLDKVAGVADAREQATVQLDPAPRTRYLLVWLTKLPAVSDGFRGEIAEISVRS